MADYPGVIPMLAYEDPAAALDWLARAFGFRERLRLQAADGRIHHAEMETEDGVIMLANPTPDYVSPKRHREDCEPARQWSSVPWVVDGVLVYISDVRQHHERAKEVGANVLSPPEQNENGTLYRVEDLEGHRWMFMER